MTVRTSSIVLRSGLAVLALVVSVALLTACGNDDEGGGTVSEESAALEEQLRAEGLSEPVIECVVRELDASGVSLEDVQTPEFQDEAVEAGEKCAQR